MNLLPKILPSFTFIAIQWYLQGGFSTAGPDILQTLNLTIIITIIVSITSNFFNIRTRSLPILLFSGSYLLLDPVVGHRFDKLYVEIFAAGLSILIVLVGESTHYKSTDSASKKFYLLQSALFLTLTAWLFFSGNAVISIGIAGILASNLVLLGILPMESFKKNYSTLILPMLFFCFLVGFVYGSMPITFAFYTIAIFNLAMIRSLIFNFKTLTSSNTTLSLRHRKTP